MARIKYRYITVLDIGSAKICGLTLRMPSHFNPQNLDLSHKEIQIIAAHNVSSMGIVAGVIQDLTKVEGAVANLLEVLEQKANHPIDSVWINASSGDPQTEYQSLEMPINGYVMQDHISDLHNQLIDKVSAQKKYIMHAVPAGYQIDGARIIQPIGMKGDQLKAQMVLITGMLGELRNLGISIERAHVDIAGRIATPIASALGCLEQSEKENGAICIDIGAETVSICAFNQNVPIHVDILKIGADYITKDIARAFSISSENAEIIKKEHGACILQLNDEKETLELPIIGSDYDITSFENRPKSDLTQIIQPRCAEMLEIIYKRLEKLGILHLAYQIVFTGGGSSLKGMEQLTAQIFGKRPRFACPIFPQTLPQNISGPEYATLIGLLHYSLGAFVELPPYQLFSKLRHRKGIAGSILNWLVKNF